MTLLLLSSCSGIADNTPYTACSTSPVLYLKTPWFHKVLTHLPGMCYKSQYTLSTSIKLRSISAQFSTQIPAYILKIHRLNLYNLTKYKLPF